MKTVNLNRDVMVGLGLDMQSSTFGGKLKKKVRGHDFHVASFLEELRWILFSSVQFRLVLDIFSVSSIPCLTRSSALGVGGSYCVFRGSLTCGIGGTE